MVESTKEIERYYEETSLSGKIEKKRPLKNCNRKNHHSSPTV